MFFTVNLSAIFISFMLRISILILCLSISKSCESTKSEFEDFTLEELTKLLLNKKTSSIIENKVIFPTLLNLPFNSKSFLSSNNKVFPKVVFTAEVRIKHYLTIRYNASRTLAQP